MLLYLLKVLKQTGHENCVGPIRIWEGVGIQYCPLLSDGTLVAALVIIIIDDDDDDGEEEDSRSASSSSTWSLLWWWWWRSIELARSEALGFGNPIWSATVTPSILSSWLICCGGLLSRSMGEQEGSSYLVGVSLRRGRASLRGGEEGGLWWWWWWSSWDE